MRKQSGLDLFVAVFGFFAIFFVNLGSSLAQSDSKEKAESYAAYLNEISDRRRVNTIFDNPQNPQKGMAVNHINVGEGNLTFARRDMVRLSRMPLVFSRIYDSSLTESGDFGPGWKLSLDETLHFRGENLIYRDASNSVHYFKNHGDGYALSTPFNSDFLSLTVDGDNATLTYKNLWSKTFERVESRFFLSSIADNNGNSQWITRDKSGLLKSIENKNSKIAVTRDSLGRVSVAEDDLGRKVSYKYDDTGVLVAFEDLGGSKWVYQYDEGRKLVGILGPNGALVMSARFESDKAVESKFGTSLTHYRYSENQTTVKNGAEFGRDFVVSSVTGVTRPGITDYFQSSVTGITQKIVNPLGQVTEIRFDKRNRVRELHRGGGMVAMFSYDSEGNVVKLTRFDDENRVLIEYNYNWHDRVVTATGSDGSELSFLYDERGNLIEKSLNGQTEAFFYDGRGDLIGLTSHRGSYDFSYSDAGFVTKVALEGAQSLEIEYNRVGRPESVTFGDTDNMSFEYTDRGFRSRTIHTDGREELFFYDAVGNLRKTQKLTDNGVLTKSYHVDVENKVVAIEDSLGLNVKVGYDLRGNPETLVVSGKSTSFEYSFFYDQLDRLKDVYLGPNRIGHYNYQNAEPDLRRQLDDRTFKTLRSGISSGGLFGSINDIAFSRGDATLFGPHIVSSTGPELSLVGDWGIGMPDAPLMAALERTKILDDNAGRSA